MNPYVKNPTNPDEVIDMIPRKNGVVKFTTEYNDMLKYNTPYISNTVLSRLRDDERVLVSKVRPHTYDIKRVS